MLREAVLRCSDCSLRRGCRGVVAGAGNEAADIMFVGEAPGKEEDKTGQPFVGKAGTMLSSLLGTLGLHREDMWIDNICHCRPPHNSDPKPEHIKACSKWLEMALDKVQPKIVVALGRFSTNYLLNRGSTVPAESYTMEHVHGVPFRRNGMIVLPAYHPAAGMHNTTLLRHIYDDFDVLGKLLCGEEPESLVPIDEFPNPVYKEVPNPRMARELLDEPEYALDLEIVKGKVWSLQVAVKPGEAYFIPYGMMHIKSTPAWSEVTVHNYLHDASYIDIPKFLDSMVAAYLLGLPQGLKELASRLCGMSMKSYQDITRPYRREKALAYLAKAVEWDAWPKPEPVEEEVWDNKVGRIVTKVRHPQPIGRKMRKILDDVGKDEETDPYQRWHDIDQRERREVERVLGVMPDSDLTDAPHDEAVIYSCRDADSTLRVRSKLIKMIRDADLEYVLRRADLPTLPIAREMMANGLPVSIGALKTLSESYRGGMDKAADEIGRLTGQRINPSSSLQVAQLVYGKLGFKSTRTTATGRMSTDDGELKKVNHPAVKAILEYRGLAKNKDGFADALVPLVVDGRVHTTIKTTRTETGRWSSSNPNLQNQPVRSEEGEKIRAAYIVGDGRILLSADVSQQEVRMMAHESQCSKLLEIYREGGDVHTETSMTIFGLDRETAKEDKYRRPAKSVTFGVIYDISPDGLLQYFTENDITGWTLDDCARMIKEWYRMYPEVWDWRQEKIAFARRHGYVTDLFGRRRYIPELLCPIKGIQSAGARQAGNMPIQGGSATMTKLMMSDLWDSRIKMGWEKKVLFIMQIHDEVLMEVVLNGKKGFELEVARWAKKVMEATVQLSVPMIVEVKVGQSWGKMEKLKL